MNPRANRAEPTHLATALRAAADRVPEDRPRHWLLLLAAAQVDAKLARWQNALRRPLAWWAVLHGGPVGGVALSGRFQA